ncbi:MAG: pyruvate dehydrogenase component alpha subunit [Thermoplasmata archaeon]|jgi:pyruvate dehydrogenase E1 component alpha subunit/2-oxoisovalerate dehydrogenase E1 component alpha subunit|nr:pyruvate dehydrogenase component alpha subunit [Thermoplasmata archaeon]
MQGVDERAPILREDGTVDKARDPNLPDAQLVKMYRAMRLTRLLDDRCMILQRQGRLAFFGSSTGEEAAVIGSASALRDDDWIFPALRQGGALLMRGFPLKAYFDHMFGNGGSVELGRSMPMHFSDRRANFVTWSSCMATQLPHAAGMAYGAKLKKTGQVAMGYLGDGASSENDFHTALNFAGVWKAPVVFFCNNNQWAISVPFAHQTASGSVAVKARAYGFPGVRLDGNDILGVHVATAEAVARARRGEGPTLVEAVTYRMQGHSSSDDPTRYRSDAEVAAWARRDPVARFARYLQQRGAWDDEKDAALTAELTEAISEAIRQSEATAAPPTDSLVKEVYADVPWHLEREYAELQESLKR